MCVPKEMWTWHFIPNWISFMSGYYLAERHQLLLDFSLVCQVYSVQILCSWFSASLMKYCGGPVSCCCKKLSPWHQGHLGLNWDPTAETRLSKMKLSTRPQCRHTSTLSSAHLLRLENKSQICSPRFSCHCLGMEFATWNCFFQVWGLEVSLCFSSQPDTGQLIDLA